MAEKPKNSKQIRWVQEVSPDGSIVNRPSYEAYTFKPPPSEIIEARVRSSLDSSTATSASYALNATSASFASTASFLLGSVESASFASTASFLTGTVTSASYALTASFLTGTVTSASYALNATSASYAVSASHEIIKEISSSYADTASFAQSGNGVFSGSFSGSYEGDGSGITGVISSSYAITASHALNAGGGGAGFPFTGDAVITGSLVVSASATSQSLSVQGSGSTVFDVIGSVGTLFSIDDDLNGMLFTANDISGFPVLQASASGDVFIGKTPQSLYTTTVISSTTAATTHSLCTLSTSSYDGAFFEYVAISGSNRRAGNIMSTWDSSIIYAETTTIDIGRTSDLTTEVIISGSTARLVAYGANAGYKIKTIIKAI